MGPPRATQGLVLPKDDKDKQDVVNDERRGGEPSKVFV